MDYTSLQLLDEEYRRTLEEVSKAETMTEEARWNLTKLKELHDQIVKNDAHDVELRKLAIEEHKADFDADMKETQAKSDKRLTIIGHGIQVFGIIISTMSADYWLRKMLEFEKTGTITSRAAQTVSNVFRHFNFRK